VPIDLLQVIPDPELSITEADIDLQLREALISTTAAIDPDLDAALLKMETMGSSVDTKVEADPLASQADYVSLLGLDNGDIDWNYLDADEDADINLF
jgi:fructose-bisphosphate aldolase class 1